MTPQHKPHKPPHARISERLRLCQENVDESPYSHPVAVDWYLQDVDHLIAESHREATQHHIEEKRLKEQLEASRELIEEAHRFALVLAELKVQTRPAAEAWLDKYRASFPASELHYEEDGSGTALPPIEESVPRGLEPIPFIAGPRSSAPGEGTDTSNQESKP